MVLIVPLKILPLLLLFLAKTTSSSKLYSLDDEQTSFIMDICKVYGPKFVVFLYAESIKEMDMTTIMFKWRRALSREGVASTNLYFSQLQKSSYDLRQTTRPYYIALISNVNAINEFSLATSTFDMSSAVWLVIFIYEENGTDYCHNPQGNIFHLRFNTEMMVRCGTENILREWYSIDTNQIEINDVATWSLEKGITKMVPDFLYERRNNLKGIIMRAVLVKDSQFTIKNKDGEIDSVFCRILKELCDTLNFSLNIVSEVEEYGRWNLEKKIWSGGIAEFYYGRADISISEFVISKDRFNAVDFTHPILNYKNILVIQERKNLMIQWSSHFLTFRGSVWCAVFGVLIVSSIFLVFLKIRSGTNRKIEYLLIDNLLEIWGIFCQQGLADYSHKSSLRIAYFSIFLLIIVFWAGYSAALISFLTSINYVLPFDSLESFVADGSYQLAVARGSAYYDRFANSKDPFAEKVMKLMLKEEKLPITEFETFERVCENRKLAMYTCQDSSTISNLKMPCNVVPIETGHRNSFAMVLSKYNQFTDVINFQLQKFIDNGMINRFKYKSFKKKSSDMIKHQPVPLISVISLILFFSIEMDMPTIMFKWKRALSREGVASTNLYFSQLQKSSYDLRQTTRPYYIALISNVNAINEFSLATSTFDMSSAVWLVIFIYEENGTDYCHNPQGNIFHLRFNTEMMVRCGTENILREWYSIDTNQIEIMDVATWSLEKGITKLVPDFLYERRNNLKGLVIKSVIVKGSTFINLKEDGELGSTFNELLRELCVALNFSFDIVSEVKEFGRWNPEENIWTGAVAELCAERADISLAGFSITNDRLSAVDFALPHVITKNYLFIRKPEIFAVEWSSHFLTFTNSVWRAMFGVLIVATVLLIFLQIKNGTDRKIGYLLIDNLLEIWGIFCQQGLADYSHKFSLRIAYFSIFLLIIVFWAGYSAALISFLTSINYVLPFDSLESFVADGSYQLAVARGSAYYDRFANSKDPFAEKVMKLMLKEEKLPTTEFEAFERVCQNWKLAIYTSDIWNSVGNMKIPCNLIRIETGHLNNFAMILSKDNPFTDVINFQLQKFIDNGMMSRLKYIFEKESSDTIKLQPVALINTASSSEFYSIGVEQTPFIVDICKLYGLKSVTFLYSESVKEMDMTTIMFKWRRALSREGVGSTNLYFSRMQESSYYLKHTIRPYYIAVISNSNAINEFSLATSTFDMSSAKWLVIFIYEKGTDYCHNPPGNIFHLGFNSEMLVRCDMENILREWYSIDKNLIEINDIATWSLEKGITKMVPDSLYERRHNLQGLSMRAVSIKDTPFVKVKKDGELDGLFGKILKELSVTLNFSFNIVSEIKEHGRWNSKEKTWSGAIAELHAGRADISLSHFSITLDRLNAVDFTIPILTSKNCLFIRKPEIREIKWSSYFLTFANSVWIATFGLLITASILLISLKIKNGNVRKVRHLLSDNFLDIWGIFCQQGIEDFSGRSSIRIAYFVIFLLVTILWAAYSAALISFLTIVMQIIPFDSLESFLQDGTYQLAVFRGTSYYDKFANSNNLIAKKLMKLMLEEEKLPQTALEGFTRICKNPKLAIYTFNEMEKSIDKIPCDVVCVETGRRNSVGIILSKHNPFTEVINFQLRKFVNNGMMDRLKDMAFTKKTDDMVKHQSVRLTDVMSLILFMLLGVLLSICILIIEKCIFVCKRKNISILDRIRSTRSSKLYTVNSTEFYSIGVEQTPFLIDICKFYGVKSVTVLYSESVKEMEMTTIMFKWRRALSREGVASTYLYFSRMHESSYYLKQTIRPYYIALISNFNAINEFSLATSTFDMSSAVWLVIFIYKENGTDYCLYPPGNIFHLKFNSEMMVRCDTENNFREWYSVNTHQIEINNVATWSLEKGITKMVPDFIYERRHNLQGLSMRAVLLKNTPFVTVKKDGELDGLFGKILEELSVTLNFSFNIVSEMEEHGRWNSKKETWSGGIGELYGGRADIALAAFSMNDDRLNAVDFTLPIFISKNYLFIREPEILAIKWSSYFSTFANFVWIATFGLLIAASILLIILKIKNGNVRKVRYLLSDNFLDIWGIFCQQGIEDFSGRSSLRIAYFSIFLLVTVLWAAYSAALISFLTLPIRILPFHSLESFVQDGTYQLIVIRSTAYYDKFANSQNQLAKKIMKLMLDEEKLPVTALEGFKKICKNQKLAFYTYEEMKKSIDDELPCNVIHVKTGRINCFAIILSKHNPFTSVINFQLQKFVNNGMMDRLKDMMFTKKPNDMVKHQSVRLTDVMSLIFFILLGVLLSICILIIEKCIFVYKRKNISILDRIRSTRSSKLYRTVGFQPMMPLKLRILATIHGKRKLNLEFYVLKKIPQESAIFDVSENLFNITIDLRSW
ncbi:hypothetical protein V1478_016941 [Vespula squamosa]|uniref:Ionotropic glutamate receptor L-glutamate and glycine-binding domain-containing protein n=1 Tax=Vespula squamosa TaxID=30214 RepID=A0ABD1ZY27_VESSQ